LTDTQTFLLATRLRLATPRQADPHRLTQTFYLGRLDQGKTANRFAIKLILPKSKSFALKIIFQTINLVERFKFRPQGDSVSFPGRPPPQRLASMAGVVAGRYVRGNAMCPLGNLNWAAQIHGDLLQYIIFTLFYLVINFIPRSGMTGFCRAGLPR
jgi:hypothetical protein